MPTQEFYIRNAGATEAWGPFTPRTALFPGRSRASGARHALLRKSLGEVRIPAGANADLKAALFPEKKKLTVKPKTNVATLNVEKEDQTPITISDMLAAAEGKTDDTKHAKDPAISRGRAAKIGLYACTIFLFIAAASEALPSINELLALDTNKILGQPLVFLGAFDLVLTLLLLLQMVTLYPLRPFPRGTRPWFYRLPLLGARRDAATAVWLSRPARPDSTSARSFWIS